MKFFTIFSLLAILAIVHFAPATEIPPGCVSGDWHASGNPYNINGEITVHADSTLNIHEGVEVIFQGHYKLIVNGFLEAIGTETDSILFTAANISEGWHSLRFIDAPDSSHLSFCIVEHGKATGLSSFDGFGGGIFCDSSNPVIALCTIRENSADSSGGGIYCRYSNLSIHQCTLSGNSGYWGGGGIYCTSSSTSIDGNIISQNSANYGRGGGIYSDGSNPTINGNVISGNSAFVYGGGIYCASSSPTISDNIISGNSVEYDGGGIYCTSSSPTISGNIMIGNSALYHGGGIKCSASSFTISGNTISRNSAINSYEPYPAYGGGISCIGTDSSSSIIGNTICANSVSGFMGGFGGGIYCSSSSLVISGNTINGNSADGGGGIHCSSSNPSIIGNTIGGNSAGSGGGIHCYASSPSISGNTINGNSASSGGGIHCSSSNPCISSNTISGNSASSGGGIHCHNNSSPSISSNTISENLTTNGGGVYCTSSPSAFEFNEISDNTASGSGGGIYFDFVSVPMNKNTIAFNVASTGGGLYSTSSSPELRNCILWANTPQQIFQTAGSNVQAIYCDIGQWWPGVGNINQDPLFVNAEQNDYRLQWSSLCIDSGDPSPQFNDPDGTQADMGCYYYDQSMAVRILLTPYGVPIQIPAEGGSFDFDALATNIDSVSHLTTIWCDITMPSGQVYGPVLGPVSVMLAPQFSVSRLRTQNIPPAAPAGMYSYNAYAVVGADTSLDYFLFEKLASDGLDGFAGWFNSGESFEDFAVATGQQPVPKGYSLSQNYPNPFNTTTTICFDLPEAGWVKLEVFDISGRMVEATIDGWRQAGINEVTFEGSRLASGVYIYQLQAGDYVANGKMVLMK